MGCWRSFVLCYDCTLPSVPSQDAVVINFFPTLVNVGHAVMGHKAALKKKIACHFLLTHLFLVLYSMYIHSECFLVFFSFFFFYGNTCSIWSSQARNWICATAAATLDHLQNLPTFTIPLSPGSLHTSPRICPCAFWQAHFSTHSLDVQAIWVPFH